MIDIHTHTLPGMDDGSKSVQESLQMLAALKQQGADRVAATPHFYATQNSPERFLERRAAAAQKLRAELTGQEPEVILGAEVLFFEGIAEAELLPELRIEGTQLLLLEMPFSPWSDRWVREVLYLNERSDITVLIAHIDRYLRFSSERTIEQLLDSGVLLQANADFFLRLATRHRALRMLRDRRLHFLGTDCHNMASRAPNLAQAQELILRKLGSDAITYLEEVQHRYI